MTRWPPWIEGRVTRNIPLEMGWEAIYLADEAPGFAGARGDEPRRSSRPSGARIRSTSTSI